MFDMYVDIALIVTSLVLIVSVIIQNKGVGLGGLTGGDMGGVVSKRRGIEKTLYYITIGLGVVFILLSLLAVRIGN